MSCLSPILIPNKALGAPERSKMYVPCNKCIGCLKDKQKRWIYRLQRECSTSDYQLFVTLTYNPESVPLLLNPTLSKDKQSVVRYSDYVKQKQIVDCEQTLFPSDLTKYYKRLRKCGLQFKYFCCGEYGDQFNRPHYHIAFFFDTDNCSIDTFANLCVEKWEFGSVDVQPLIDARMTYITKYLLKSDLESAPNPYVVQCFNRVSRGLGLQGFMKDYEYYMHYDKSGDFLKQVQLNNGSTIALPRYFRTTVLSDETPVFDYDLQQIQEIERNKRENEKFENYVKKYQIKMGSKCFETITRNYFTDYDSQRQTEHHYLERRRRKGI